MTWLFASAAVLVLWAGIAALRRRGEYDQRPEAKRPRGQVGKDQRQEDSDDRIDYDILEQAEREVQDLDPMTRPDDGFEGDDWGPGSPRQRS